MEEFELKRLVEELERIKGKGTQLISLYIPAGANLVEIINTLHQEKVTAENIKSKQTRKNVIGALEKICSHLKSIKKTPKPGLIIFCGNVAEHEGVSDIRLWSIEPPEPLKTKLYWCDQRFRLEPLKELIEEKEIYGLIVLDSSEACLGLLKGKRIEVIKHMESMVPGKTVKGGMCVSADSLVQLENGEIKRIKDLSLNDKLLVFSFKDFKPEFAQPKQIFKRKVNKAYKIVTKEPTFRLVASPEHRIFVLKNGIEEVSVEDLKIGDRVFLSNHFAKPVTFKVLNPGLIQTIVKEKREIKPNGEFYDLYIPKYNSFFANGILVHNSQRRYDRIIEQALEEFLTKIAEKAKEFLNFELKGLLIGGPGHVKHRLIEYLDYRLKGKVLGIVDIGYADEYGLEELVERGKNLIKEAKVIKEKELLKSFFSRLAKEESVSFKFDEITQALEAGNVETLLISEDLDLIKVKGKCQKDHTVELIAKEEERLTCKLCGSPLKVEEIVKLRDWLVEKAKTFGARVEFVSKETSEGIQFRSLGGIGALLRKSTTPP